MILKDFFIEYQENPIGLDVKKPRFSWKLFSKKKDVLQTAYHILVTKSGEVVWDSGKCNSSSSVLVEYGGQKLEKCTRYDVQVEVWDNHGNQGSKTGFFETG